MNTHQSFALLLLFHAITVYGMEKPTQKIEIPGHTYESLEEGFIIAAQHNFPEQLQKFIDLGVDVNIINPKTKAAIALIYASLKGHTDIMKILLDQANIDVTWKNNPNIPHMDAFACSLFAPNNSGTNLLLKHRNPNNLMQYSISNEHIQEMYKFAVDRRSENEFETVYKNAEEALMLRKKMRENPDLEAIIYAAERQDRLTPPEKLTLSLKLRQACEKKT